MQELKSLVVQAQNGHLEAYDGIVLQLQDMAVAYGYSVLGDWGLAEDAAQEAFVEAFFCLSQLREPAAFSAWLRRIVWKHCDRLTRKKRLTMVSLDAALEHPSPGCEPEAMVEAQEVAIQVREAVASLPEHERVPTLLFYIGDYSQQQIAEFLEVPVTTIKKRLQRARMRLKNNMMNTIENNLQEQRPSQNAQFAHRVQELMKNVYEQTEAMRASDKSISIRQHMAQNILGGDLALARNEIERANAQGADTKELMADWHLEEAAVYWFVSAASHSNRHESPAKEWVEKMIVATQQSIELSPSADAYFNLGQAYEALNRKSEAIAAFQTSATLGSTEATKAVERLQAIP